MGGNVFLQDVIRNCNVQFSDSNMHELPLHPKPAALDVDLFRIFSPQQIAVPSKTGCHSACR